MKSIRVSIGTEPVVDIPPSAWPSEDHGWVLENMVLAGHFVRFVTEDARTWLEFRLYSTPVAGGGIPEIRNSYRPQICFANATGPCRATLDGQGPHVCRMDPGHEDPYHHCGCGAYVWAVSFWLVDHHKSDCHTHTYCGSCRDQIPGWLIRYEQPLPPDSWRDPDTGHAWQCEGCGHSMAQMDAGHASVESE